MDKPFLTDRLRLRPFTSDDIDAGFALWSDPEVGRFTGGAHASREQSTGLIAAHQRNQRIHGFSLWAVEHGETGDLLGEAGLQPLEGVGPEVEIGWAFAPRAWGHGYATEAARAWLDRAFTVHDRDAVIAVIRPGNAASHRVAERLGMSRSPALRHVYGARHAVYSVLRSEWSAGARAR